VTGNHVTGDKVKVGFFSFTEITDPDEHRSYNEWHQLDHMPEQFPLRGIAFGQRWVSTPACRSARAVSGERLDAIHYVTLYLVTEPVEQTLSEFVEWGRELHRRGRFHQHRRALLSGPFAVRDTAVAPRVLISAAAVPYRPHRGVYVTVEPVAGSGTAPVVDRWCALPGVAGAWSFSDDDYEITVAWLDGAPLEVAGDLPTPPSDAIFAGPFETITAWEWDWFDR
jgi:hypothetical protein